MPATPTTQHTPEQGAQRLPLSKLHAWEKLEYGMFIHFGMSTYSGNECGTGLDPSTLYAPDKFDVAQWVSVARDAGMKYAVLTAKHVSGHCLWPSALTDYTVRTSSNKTDVVEQFVRECEKKGVMDGLYYCSWDNHHQFGSVTPDKVGLYKATTTEQYRAFQHAQIEELLTHYGPIGEVWIDIPGPLGTQGRRDQYNQIAKLNPDAVIMLNQGTTEGTRVQTDYAWPTDIMAIERSLPTSNRGYNPWHRVNDPTTEKEADYYLAGEVCDPVGYEWFHAPGDRPRTDAELLGMRLVARARGANLLLDVPPDKSGVIPKQTVDALMRLRTNTEKFLA